MNYLRILSFIAMPLLFSSCARHVEKAINKAKYSAWETVGFEKRDLFKREVSNVKESQEDTGEAFKDALTKLKEVYAFDGGNLEREYNKLYNSYTYAEEDATEVRERILKLNTIATDLFEEWEGEIKEITSSDLRQRSSEQLRETKKRYRVLHSHLKTTEEKIGPVLVRLKDQVTFLKHNLNAKAVAGLKSEGNKIENDIEKLMREMQTANNEAESFIKTL